MERVVPVYRPSECGRFVCEVVEQDLSIIIARIKSAKSAPLIMLQCGAPTSVQQVANDCWAELGTKLGFDPMTVQPNGRGDRFFSAMPVREAHDVGA